MRRERLFQLHIPKTAGTTLYSVLLTRIPRERVLLMTKDPVCAGEVTAGAEGVDLVAGHLSWAAVGAFPEPPAVLTVLRDPVERALSVYSYLRVNAGAGIFDPGSEGTAQEAAMRPLGDMLLDRTSGLRHVVASNQVGYLSGDEPNLRQPAGFLTPSGDLDTPKLERCYEIAERNLLTCAWVGTTETLDRDLETLAARLGWPSFGAVQRRNVTRDRQSAESLPSRARRELEQLVEADRELHARARTIADERYRAVMTHGDQAITS
jgi:hypothetical protein